MSAAASFALKSVGLAPTVKKCGKNVSPPFRAWTGLQLGRNFERTFVSHCNQLVTVHVLIAGCTSCAGTVVGGRRAAHRVTAMHSLG